MKTKTTLTALLMAATTAAAHAQEAPRCTIGAQTATHSQYFASNAPFSEKMVQENIGYAACDNTTLAGWKNHYQGEGWIDKGVALEQIIPVGERTGAINLALLNIDGFGNTGHLDASLHGENTTIGAQRLIGFVGGDGTRGYFQARRSIETNGLSAAIQAELGVGRNYLHEGTGLDASIQGKATYDLKPFTFELGSGIVRDASGSTSPVARIGIGIYR